MLIGELSIKTGLSRDTIRFYEKQGLIFIGKNNRKSNNYKDYPDSVLSRLLIIKHIKGFGFTLNEISGLIDMIESKTASCSSVSKKVSEKIEIVDKKIQELMEFKATLVSMITNCCGAESENENCPALVPN